MTPRAPAMAPDERRAAIIAAAAPLLSQDPLGFTTRKVAEVAGIAEGTIFRCFDTKADLIEAVANDMLDPTPTVEALRALHDDDLETTVRAILTMLCESVGRIGTLFAALATTGEMAGCSPAQNRQQHLERMSLLDEAIAHALAPHQSHLRHPLTATASYLRSLAFLIAHPGSALSDTIEPEAILDLFLHGAALTSLPAPEEPR